MTKWVYLGTVLALIAVAGVTGQLLWLFPAGVMTAALGLNLANERRRERERNERR